ncbi:MAG: ATP-dependent RNA helicase HrpA, partial [Gammaproteobacteria bacterium]
FSGAPLLEVSGRQYPVDMQYHDVGELLGERPDSPEAIAWALSELLPLLRSGPLRGRDGLVFLPTERHIQAASRHLRKHMPPHVSVLPLYARLPQQEQEKIFKPSGNSTRIILTTNVAETSLTVPNIGFVIDSGTARISQYSVHSKVQRLPIEPIAQSNAQQRAGRCGRIGPGLCWRLYSERDFLSRAEHTTPEILRSHLASVLLQLIALRLGSPDDFPFLDRPDPRLMRDGFQCLLQIGAIKRDQAQTHPALTSLGRDMVQLPLDPRLARILLAAPRFNCLTEQLILVSFLGVQDPRERSFWDDVRQAQCFQTFFDDESDFMAVLKLWHWCMTEKSEQTRRGFQKTCRALGLSVVRLYEWFNLHRQLVLWTQRKGWQRNETPATYEHIHRALLTGWPLEIAMQHPEGYHLGTRGRKLAIFPGNPLKKKKFPWMLVGEIIETEKQYAHRIAKIDPLWVEAAADGLIKRHIGEPFWDKKRAQVRVYEQGELLGLTLYHKRARSLAALDPVAAREYLIRFALVDQRWASGLPFQRHNDKILASLAQWEHKLRRLDLRADEQTLYAFFDRALPADITDCRRLKQWANTKLAAQESGKSVGYQGDKLCFTLETVLEDFAHALDMSLWPDTWLTRAQHKAKQNGEKPIPFLLSYHFDMSDERDGVTMIVPEARLNELTAADLSWLVPGYWPDLIQAAVRVLPKSWRRRLPPLPNWRERALTWLTTRFETVTDRQENVFDALRLFWFNEVSVDIPASEMDAKRLPDWLRFWVRVESISGQVLAEGRDWERISGDTAQQARELIQQTAPSHPATRSGARNRQAQDQDGQAQQGARYTTWAFGDLSEVLTLESMPTGYCALRDVGDAVEVTAFSQKGAAKIAHRQGLIRLYILACAAAVRQIKKQTNAKSASVLLGIRAEELIQQSIAKAVDTCFVSRQNAWYDQASFTACLAEHRAELIGIHQQLMADLVDLGEAVKTVKSRLLTLQTPPVQGARHAIEAQLSDLLVDDFISITPQEWLSRFPVYCRGMLRRIERLSGNIERDAENEAAVQQLMVRYQDALSQRAFPSADLKTARWLIEEWRLSLFAQGLKTCVKVSDKRIQKHIDEHA